MLIHDNNDNNNNDTIDNNNIYVTKLLSMGVTVLLIVFVDLLYQVFT